MGGLIFFICCIAVLAVLIGLYKEAPENVRERIKHVLWTLLILLVKKSDNSSSTRSSSRQDSVEYVPQRMGGTGVWLNVGNSFSNVGAAIASAEYSKKRNPKDAHRVAEKINGKIVGTAYSC